MPAKHRRFYNAYQTSEVLMIKLKLWLDSI